MNILRILLALLLALGGAAHAERSYALPLDEGNNCRIEHVCDQARIESAACCDGTHESIEPIDWDSDGFPEDSDACPESIIGPTVVVDGNDSGVRNVELGLGCTLADQVSDCALRARVRKELDSCVKRLATHLSAQGVLTLEERQQLVSFAALLDTSPPRPGYRGYHVDASNSRACRDEGPDLTVPFVGDRRTSRCGIVRNAGHCPARVTCFETPTSQLALEDTVQPRGHLFVCCQEEATELRVSCDGTIGDCRVGVDKLDDVDSVPGPIGPHSRPTDNGGTFSGHCALKPPEERVIGSFAQVGDIDEKSLCLFVRNDSTCPIEVIWSKLLHDEVVEEPPVEIKANTGMADVCNPTNPVRVKVKCLGDKKEACEVSWRATKIPKNLRR